MSDNVITYAAAVYTRDVTYTNFKGETRTLTLHFALDPLQLMTVMAGFEPKKKVKSGNPAARDKAAPITDEQQIKMVRDLVKMSAGVPSEDGEAWEPFEDFEDSLAGKAFMTKLVSSDADRKEFSEKVILAPFRAFVDYAKADVSNSKVEIAEFDRMLEQMTNIFAAPAVQDETLEARRERLAAELESLSE